MPERTEPRHHWVVRVTHWVNVVALAVMVGSGLRIFNAYPRFARRGETFCCWPWEGTRVPDWLTFGGWLAGARNWHFAAMWALFLNGLVYVGFLWLHGEWRDLVPRRGDPRDAWQMVRFYLFLRRDHPRQGKHNALQKWVYFALPWLGLLAVLTGLAIWKPVQLDPLTDLFGGYVWARWWHFVVMLALVALSIGHVFMVFAVDPQSLRAMTTGGYDESRSPEARNARPFFRGRPVTEPESGGGRETMPVIPASSVDRVGDGDADRNAVRADGAGDDGRRADVDERIVEVPSPDAARLGGTGRDERFDAGHDAETDDEGRPTDDRETDDSRRGGR